MVRTYSRKPYTVAVVHGGPGDKGSLAVLARTLSRVSGVLEPIQSGYTVDALVDELHAQLRGYSGASFTLIGHSWGAWLCMLCAAKYPAVAKSLVLVGCAPFEPQYVPLILENRLEKLPGEEARSFEALLNELDAGNASAGSLERLQDFLYRTDNYCPVDFPGGEDHFPFDNKMHTSVWDEASRLRETGKLSARLPQIGCPVYVVHGQDDPHPLSGVTGPLSARGVSFKVYELPRCGHSPFWEKYAAGDFFRILEKIVTAP